MSRYNTDFPFPIAFPPQGMSDVLAETLSKQGIKQAHVAETEKYAHVTFFFNGGVEKQFENEERHMIPSPKVPTYDQQPEMSVQAVADKVSEVVKEGKHEFVMCNFAPPDMVRTFWSIIPYSAHYLLLDFSMRRLVILVNTMQLSKLLQQRMSPSGRSTKPAKKLVIFCSSPPIMAMPNR